MRSRWPFHVMAKPIGPVCNLACSYCYYLEKRALYEPGHAFRMSDKQLSSFIDAYIAAQPVGAHEVAFSWQGGEPTLLGIAFFERVVELQQRHVRSGLQISNALQTNATLLDDDWCRFLSANGFLVGVSIDGPEEIHDAQRHDGRGKGSFRDVLAAIERMKRHSVEFNTLTVLQRDNCGDPAGLYDFLKQIGSRFFQFIPIVEHAEGLQAKRLPGAIGSRLADSGARVSQHTIEAEQWGSCMSGIFDRWIECNDVGNVFVQSFEVALAILGGYPSTLCVNAERCGRALAIEHDGDVYSCDHFVSPEHRLGNLAEQSLPSMLESDRQQAFREDKHRQLPAYCRRCPHLDLCWGACPKDRIATTPDGEPGLAYLCEGYRAFYRHCVPTFREMLRCLELGYPASRFQELDRLERKAKAPPGVGKTGKVGRNAPCPCGSGAKYKHCCGSA